MSWELWLLVGLAALGLFWWDGLQKRELAVRTARAACARAGVQFLDDTVALVRLRLAKDAEQRSRFYREYGFEFSTTGDDRHPGRVYLLGPKVLDVSLILPAAAPAMADAPQTAEILPFPPARRD